MTWWRNLPHDTRRLIQHIPCGILNAVLVVAMPLPGAIASFGFFFYEGIQDWRKGDRSYKDVIGWLDGFNGALIIALLWREIHG